MMVTCRICGARKSRIVCPYCASVPVARKHYDVATLREVVSAISQTRIVTAAESFEKHVTYVKLTPRLKSKIGF